jgi:hypothetical protein
MTMSKATALTIVTVLGASALMVPAGAGGDKVTFPQKYTKGILFTTVDRSDNKQVRKLYASRAAINAAKKGMPMPNGTVLTMVNFAAELGSDGNPVKDASGRFIKTNTIVGYVVMEKRAGWGKEYPDNVRNGE